MNYEELLTRYPILFSKFSYFECNNGWFYIINDASFELEQINRSFSNPEYKVVAFQIKDKFGSLRYYVEFSDALVEDEPVYNKVSNKVYTILQKVENLSSKVCQSCAGELSVRNSTKGYKEVYCEKCSTK